MRTEGAPEDTRVILHIDLDCFYAQVEHRRLGIPQTVPLAVQQWDGLIAVNYAARAAGITRHMRVADAKKACPEITLVHVETIGDAGASTADDGTTTNAANAAARLTQKACLERYRRANAEIMAVLHRLAPTAVIEKASIDEVYIDVSTMVEGEIEGAESSGSGDACAWGAIVLGPSPLDPGSAFDRRLAAGAGIACRLRGAVAQQLGFTSSAGIAGNKLLAKIGSALHKPNQMTCIPPRAVPALMADLPLRKLKNFGGKLGARLEEELGCATAGQVAALPMATLETAFGADSARWIAAAVRGRSDDPVEERERPKSMLAAKSFGATSDHAVLRRWIGILAAELAPRMATDEGEHRRRAKTLKVHYRGGSAPGTERSRQGPMPTAPGGPPDADAIAAAAWEIFKARCAAEALPGCSRLAISAADFADLPAAGKSAITKFLVPKTAGAAGVEDDGGGSGGGGGLKREAEPAAAQQQTKEEAPHPAKMAKRENSAAPGAGAVKAGEGAAELPEELSGIDMAEQRRLMKELELMKALEDAKKKKKKEGGGGGKAGGKSGGGGGGSSGKAGSRAITQFFARKG